MNQAATAPRSVNRVLPSVRTVEGGGFAVRRPFPSSAVEQVDPFLLLDEMGPADYGPGEARGAPDHPHRGFETVTYLLAGNMEHRDSAGNHGVLGPGDVQWMTAGAGVVHSEMPGAEITRAGGRMHGFQLWVNLPARAKKIPPRYQDTPAAAIPEISIDGGAVTVRVVAGTVLGARSPIETHTPILYLHLRMLPGARIEIPLPHDHVALAYVFGGQGRFDTRGTAGHDGELVSFASNGAAAAIESAAGGLELLLLAGEPLGEPVARYGPFVMNTREEILEAFDDYRSGRMGRIG